MEIIYLSPNEIHPYERNPRFNDQAVDAVAKSIEQYGWHSPLVLDKNNVIICGHTRYKAALQMGIESIPCIIAADLTPEQVKAYRIADNRLAELATWNYEVLIAEIESLQDSDLDLSLLDFEIVNLAEPIDDKVKEGKTDPNDVPDEPVESKSKAGALYKLGDHILLCGDSTKKEDIQKLMGEDLAILYLVDPPYNVAISNSNGLKIKNDDMADDKFYEFLNSAFRCASMGLEPGAVFYIYHSDSETINFRQTCIANNFDIQQTLYWVKNSLVLGRLDYHYMTEPCLYGWKRGGQYRWYGERQQSNLLRYNKPKANPDHPTPKPVEMLVYLIKNSSQRGDLVLDNFGGSGSTLIACEQTGRRCRMIELDEKYCDVIRRRWAEFIHGEGCDWETLTPEIKKEKTNEKNQ
jgi:site-specific DNA-methyltransferase (adenine-specific)